MSRKAFSPVSFRVFILSGGAIVFAASCQQANWSPPVSPSMTSDNIVNVGYALRAERDLTGSISSLRSQQFTGRHFATVADMLRDRVPGVQVMQAPDGSSSIRIRGTRSILGNNEPLILVDGVPFGVATGALDTLDPAIIERIDVLKDAGSTSAYGSRGSNGVILITTKH